MDGVPQNDTARRLGVSFYMVLVDRDFKYHSTESTSARVFAHNLSQEDARSLAAQFAESTVAGRPTGFTAYVAEYAESHAQTDPNNCLECQEAALDHNIRMLRLLEDELAKKSAK